MHHIIYLSRATKSMTDDELAGLLHQARSANEKQGVTGVLFYGDNQFLQIMEGEESVIALLYEHIAKDSRHDQLIKMADKPIGARNFADWSMAFKAVPAAQFASLSGYVLLEEAKTKLLGMSAADALLLEMARQFALPSSRA